MDPAGDRVALLIIRVWVEEGADPPAMRARLTATADLVDRGAEQRITVAADVEEVITQVRRWLNGFIASPRQASGPAPQTENP